MENYGTARQVTDHMIRRMRFAYCKTKAVDTHSAYVIFIVFPLQKWLREKAPVLYHTYVACLLSSGFENSSV